MLQRIQTIFLFGISILSVVFIFMPFQYIQLNETETGICLMPGCSNLTSTNLFIPLIINCFCFILSLTCIFLYKKRILQIKICMLIVSLSMLLTGVLFVFNYTNLSADYNVTYSITSALPLVYALLALIARHFIKKDEALVRSADRIR